MKKLLYFIMVFALLCASPVWAANRYGCTCLIGGTSGCLDALDITGASAPNVDNLADGDSAIVKTISVEDVTKYEYIFDADGTTAESSPSVIRPDDYATQGVWRLVVYSASSVETSGSDPYAQANNADGPASPAAGMFWVEGNDFKWYSSAEYIAATIEMPTLELDDLDDTSTPHNLITEEHNWKIISNGNATGSAVLTLDEHTGQAWNFYVQKEANQDFTIDVHANDEVYFRHQSTAVWTQLSAGEDVENVGDGVSSLYIYATDRDVFVVSDGKWNPVTTHLYARPAISAIRSKTINATGGDDSSLTSEDLYGSTIYLQDGGTANDLILPDCTTDVPIFTWHIRICQQVESQTVSIAPASGDDFQLRDGTALTDNHELDSPGAAARYMCVLLGCQGSENRWHVLEETGGDSALDHTWVSGGAAD